MPGGLVEPLQGILAFTSIKFVGYSLAALYLNKSYPNSTNNFLVVGLVRTIIGIVFGIILTSISFPFVFIGGLGFLVYILGLIPVRLLEWSILIRFFYDESVEDKHQLWKHKVLGTLWSFILEAISKIV